MSQLKQLIDLGVKELQVTNHEATAVNPYEPVIWNYNPVREINNPDWQEFKNLNLPPLPCPSVPDGTYEIGRFEERFRTDPTFRGARGGIIVPYLVLKEQVENDTDLLFSGFRVRKVVGYKCTVCGTIGGFDDFPYRVYYTEYGKGVDTFCKTKDCDGQNDDLDELLEDE